MSLVSTAARTPLARGPVVELSKAEGLDGRALRAALDADDPTAATVLAYALVARGEKLAPELLVDLVPELEETHIGPLVLATAGDPVDLILKVLDDGRAGPERDALLVVLAADLRGKEVPRGIVAHARRLSRLVLEPEQSRLVGAAAVRIGDADLSSVAAKAVAVAKRQKRAVEEILENARRPASQALGDSAGPRIVVGYTVKRDGPEVGRNDPCPCGSGKKYKKCHALESEAPRARIAAIDEEQARWLRASEVAKLDLGKLADKTLLGVYRRTLLLHRWDLAERALAEIARRKTLAEKKDEYRWEMLNEALYVGDRARAEEVHASLPAKLAARDDVALALLRGGEGALDALEKGALAALREENDGAAAIELAYAVLRRKPALGIFLARGALHEGRIADCEALLEAVEDARDKLLVSPFEPWWDLYDEMVDASDDRLDRLAKSEEEKKRQEQLREARKESRRANMELTRLKEQLEVLDAKLAPPSVEPRRTESKRAPEAPKERDPELEEERRRLRLKVEEMQRIIGEGQEERRELRKKLAEIAEEDDREPAPPTSIKEGDDEDDDEPGDATSPFGVLVPHFTDRASKALLDLAAQSADAVLGVVAGLAAGKPNAWGGTKQLKKVRGVYSARGGIHHRVLFDVERDTLRVLEIIHRKDLEVVVARLAEK